MFTDVAGVTRTPPHCHTSLSPSESLLYFSRIYQSQYASEPYSLLLEDKFYLVGFVCVIRSQILRVSMLWTSYKGLCHLCPPPTGHVAISLIAESYGG